MISPKTPLREWRQIARELAVETNCERIIELSNELEQAFEQQKAAEREIEKFAPKVA